MKTWIYATPAVKELTLQKLHHSMYEINIILNRHNAQLNYLIFHPLKVVSRYCKTQLQVNENYPYLFSLRPTFASLDV